MQCSSEPVISPKIKSNGLPAERAGKKMLGYLRFWVVRKQGML